MAEVGLTTSKLQWVVFSPSLYASHWRSKLYDLAAVANVSVWDDPKQESSACDFGIVLTDDLSRALSCADQPDCLTAVALPPVIDLQSCGDDAEVNACVEALSARINAIYAFPSHVDLDRAEVISIPGLPTFASEEILKKQVRPMKPREAALQQALGVFTQGECVWSPPLFTYDKRNDLSGPETGHLDVTGRPRFLVSGPYITMPVGTWRAQVSLSFDDDVSHRRFRIDWGGVETYASHEFCPGQSGRFDITLEHHWAESSPAELRIIVLEGVFHGHLLFEGAVISRL